MAGDKTARGINFTRGKTQLRGARARECNFYLFLERASLQAFDRGIRKGIGETRGSNWRVIRLPVF